VSRPEAERVAELVELLVETPVGLWEERVQAECAGDDRLAEEVLALARSAREGEAYLDTLSRRLGLARRPDSPDGLIGSALGPYRLEKLLGRGGQGSVYLAARDDGRMRVRAAVKLVSAGLFSAQARERFFSERQILSGLEHPNIARLFDGGIANDGTPYFVMEYVDGSPIDQYCDKHRLGVRERIELVLQVCAAVGHAHQNLVIHRDIKPGNVLVDGHGTAKLLDFGIAKALGAEGVGFLTSPAQPPPMTVAFASPEQIRGEPLGTGADVYGVGVLLYRLLTGRHPYAVEGRSLDEIHRAICETDPLPPRKSLDERIDPPGDETRPSDTDPSAERIADLRSTSVSRLRRELSGDLASIVLTALRKEPERRYDGIHELAADLHAYLEGRPVSARPDTVGYRVRRFAGRHRVSVAAAAALGLMAAALAVVAVRYTVDTRAYAARIAEESRTTAEVSDLLVEVLRLADPGEGGGDTLTVRAALSRGVEAQRTRLANRPELGARLLSVVARAYTGLGLLTEATPLVQEAIDLYPRRGTMADTVLGQLIVQLGATYQRRGQYADALRELERALELYDEIGADSLLIGGVMSEMQVPLAELGALDSARAVGARGLALRRDRLGASDRSTAATTVRYAQILYRIGEADSAVSLLRDVVAIGETADHPAGDLIAGALNNLGTYLRRRGDFAGAAASYRRALDDYGDWIALDNRHMLRANLATALRFQGDSLGAVAVLTERLDRAREWWPGGHWRVGQAAGDLGNAYLQFGEPERAAPFLREAVATYHELLGPEHRWTALAESALGEALTRVGESAEAERCLLEAYRKLSAVAGPEDEALRTTARRLADLYEGQGRPADAAQYRSMADESHRRRPPAPEDPTR